jgi:hypothetical protein
MKFSMESEKFTETMNKLKLTVRELKKIADEAGADIDNCSLDFKLYLESKVDNELQISAAEKRKKLFEGKIIKNKITE